jgi:CBS domain-containing protein
MKVFQAVTPSARIAHPNDTLQEAAQIMCECDFGFLPVGQNDRLVGMITDRDIAVRAVACGAQPTARIGDFMTRDVKYCYADDDLDEVLDNMADVKVRRLPVLDSQKRLVGILSLSDAAQEYQPRMAGQALSRIATPGGAHSQMPLYDY